MGIPPLDEKLARVKSSYMCCYPSVYRMKLRSVLNISLGLLLAVTAVAARSQVPSDDVTTADSVLSTNLITDIEDKDKIIHDHGQKNEELVRRIEELEGRLAA